MILVLEVGLFRLASQRGAARRFWLGFEVAGWTYVITCEVFAWTAWRLARSLFEGYVLRRPIGPPFEMQRFIFFAGGLQLVISLALALIIGMLTRWTLPECILPIARRHFPGESSRLTPRPDVRSWLIRSHPSRTTAGSAECVHSIHQLGLEHIRWLYLSRTHVTDRGPGSSRG